MRSGHESTESSRKVTSLILGNDTGDGVAGFQRMQKTQRLYFQRPSIKTYPSFRCSHRGATQTACSRGGTSHLPGPPT